MPRASSSYDTAQALLSSLGREGIDLGPAPNFFGDLHAVRGIPARRARPVAPVYNGPVYGSGSGPITTEGKGYGGGGDAVGQGRALGRHSFVRNVSGANILGGFVSSPSGPGSVYGGWQVDDGGGPVHLANTPAPWRAQYPTQPEIDPAIKSAIVNQSLGPSLADRQRSERESLYERYPAYGASASQPYRQPSGRTRSYSGGSARG